MQIETKECEEELRKQDRAKKKLEKSATVYSWLKKRGKNVKKVVDTKTRKDMKEVICQISFQITLTRRTGVQMS
jgi:predicted oxidoreductase